jgi:hypothetical protein
MYVCEFFILVFVFFFVANKSLNVQNLLFLINKVKFRAVFVQIFPQIFLRIQGLKQKIREHIGSYI